jgi:hypothetical protein
MARGKGVDIVIESIGANVTSEALSSLGLGGVLITLGYSAGRKTTIDLTDLIWKRARMTGFSLFAQSPATIATAWHHPAGRGRIRQTDCRADLLLRPSRRSPAPSDRRPAFWQGRPDDVTDMTRGYSQIPRPVFSIGAIDVPWPKRVRQ